MEINSVSVGLSDLPQKPFEGDPKQARVWLDTHKSIILDRLIEKLNETIEHLLEYDFNYDSLDDDDGDTFSGYYDAFVSPVEIDVKMLIKFLMYPTDISDSELRYLFLCLDSKLDIEEREYSSISHIERIEYYKKAEDVFLQKFGFPFKT